MRITFFPASAIGHVDYPEALVTRGLASALAERAHYVRIVEERRNPVLLKTLQVEGESVARNVYEGFPELLIHSYEQRTGAPLMEWTSRELSLLDAAVAVDGLPLELCLWIANLDHPTLTRIFLTIRPQDLTDELVKERELERFDLILATAQPAADIEWRPLTPAVAAQDDRADLVTSLPVSLREMLIDASTAAQQFEGLLRTANRPVQSNGHL